MNSRGRGRGPRSWYVVPVPPPPSPLLDSVHYALVADLAWFRFVPKKPVSIQAYPGPGGLSASPEPAPSPNCRQCSSSRMPRPRWYDWRRGPFVDGGRASTRGSRAGLTGEGLHSLRIAVLIALPAPLHAEKNGRERLVTMPPLCFALVDAGVV